MARAPEGPTIEGMRILLFCVALALLPGPPAAAAETRRLPRATEVRSRPDPTRPAVLELDAGDEVGILATDGEFTQIRLRRAGGWKRGWVWTADLEAEPFPEPAARELGQWGLGILGQYSGTSQGARSFRTEDQVDWRTSAYRSDTVWPALYLQYGRLNHWRIAVGRRPVFFKGTATLDVGVPNSRVVVVQQTMWSGRVEKAFNVWRGGYVSIGGEVARANQVKETLGGVDIPTDAQDLNVYAGGALGVGYAWYWGERASAGIEARYALFASLKPPVQSLDVGAGVSFWF